MCVYGLEQTSYNERLRRLLLVYAVHSLLSRKLRVWSSATLISASNPCIDRITLTIETASQSIQSCEDSSLF